jgi:prepilin-type processing-associated H-X9-DG protein
MKKYPLLVCPSEKIPFGRYNDTGDNKGFSYTHYGLNTELTGRQIRNDYSSMHRTSSLHSPSLVLTIADSRSLGGYILYNESYMAFRHGGNYLRDVSGSGTVTNCAYFDGHVALFMINDFSRAYGTGTLYKGYRY